MQNLKILQLVNSKYLYLQPTIHEFLNPNNINLFIFCSLPLSLSLSLSLSLLLFLWPSETLSFLNFLLARCLWALCRFSFDFFFFLGWVSVHTVLLWWWGVSHWKPKNVLQPSMQNLKILQLVNSKYLYLQSTFHEFLNLNNINFFIFCSLSLSLSLSYFFFDPLKLFSLSTHWNSPFSTLCLLSACGFYVDFPLNFFFFGFLCIRCCYDGEVEGVGLWGSVWWRFRFRIGVVEGWVYGLAWWRVWVCGDQHLWWTSVSVVECGGSGLWSRFVFAMWFMVVAEVWVIVVVGWIVLVVMGWILLV